MIPLRARRAAAARASSDAHGRGDHRRPGRLAPRRARRPVRRRRAAGPSSATRRSSAALPRRSSPTGRSRRSPRSAALVRDRRTPASSASPARPARRRRRTSSPRSARRARPHGRRGGELQQRDRRPAHALPARARHRGLHPRARHARLRPDRRALPDRAAARRRDHERRARAPRAGRLARGRRSGRRASWSRRSRGRRRPSCRTEFPVERDDIEVVPPGAARGRAVEDGRTRSSAASASTSRPSTRSPTPPPRCARSTRSACRAPSGVDVEFSPWRGEELPLPGGGLLINDAYNANPVSMRAALAHLAALAGGAAPGRDPRRHGRARARRAGVPRGDRRASRASTASRRCWRSASWPAPTPTVACR